MWGLQVYWLAKLDPLAVPLERVQSGERLLEHSAKSLGLRVSGLGFKVQGLGFKVCLVRVYITV